MANTEPRPAPSKVEVLKAQSNHLRGTIKATLESDASFFSEAEYQLLKFHGTYQQDDRDRRRAARTGTAEKAEKSWMMMVRAKIPAGGLTAQQYLAFDQIADRFADGTLRITSRQCFQFHYVLKRDLKQTIRDLNDALVTTLGACGDVVRNVMACAAPDATGARAAVGHYARLLSDATLPNTRAYHEIWLDGERIISTDAPETEPLYGETYLPRKFKIALAVEGDNCVDVYSQDLGIVAHLEGDTLAGFTLLVGGGMGMTHGNATTYPRLAEPLGFVAPDRLVEVCLAVVGVQRDHGNRSSRRHARLKYLIEQWGIERFREAVEQRLGWQLAPPRPLRWQDAHDHLGWHRQHDGRWYLGVWVQNGRIADRGGARLKTAFRELVQRFRPDIVLTPQQNLLFTGIDAAQKREVEALLQHYGVPLAEALPGVLRHSLACPALPTCGLALTDAERALPGVLHQIHGILREIGLEEMPLSVRMTGCPNGCARPYLGDIGFVGRTQGKYQIYLGGDVAGTRLSRLFADLVPLNDLAERLRPVFLRYHAERWPGEGFGDFCHRVGVDSLRAAAESSSREPAAAGAHA